jgi:CRISPR/Cas system CSM-associated protein Csm3 (group 7 of RAMP superfamily)
MSRLKIEWQWTLKGQFHIGAGIGRVGYADSILRKDGQGKFFIPGDAVKGAVREGAERFLHWLWPARCTVSPSTSFPDHPLIEALFAPPPDKPFYRFLSGKQNGDQSMRMSSTAIRNATGVADDTTLRIIETLPPKTAFTVSITGEGGEWLTEGGADRMALIFLLAALYTVEAVGGKRGVGHGEVAVEGLTCAVDDRDILEDLLPGKVWQRETLEQLRQHVEQTKGGERP